MKINILKSAMLGIIGFYKTFISPVLGSNCRFYPSCSSYTRKAIEKYGILRGMQKGFWRILKCNPLNKGGIDLP